MVEEKLDLIPRKDELKTILDAQKGLKAPAIWDVAVVPGEVDKDLAAKKVNDFIDGFKAMHSKLLTIALEGADKVFKAPDGVIDAQEAELLQKVEKRYGKESEYLFKDLTVIADEISKSGETKKIADVKSQLEEAFSKSLEAIVTPDGSGISKEKLNQLIGTPPTDLKGSKETTLGL